MTVLIFLGDYCASNSVLASLSHSFVALLQDAQLVCANFEAPILSSSSKSMLKMGPALGQSPCALETCRSWGINYLALANNHIMDFGTEGLANTLQNANGFGVFGAGLCFNDAYRPQFCELNNNTVALLAFSEAQFGVLQDESFDGAGFAWIDHPKARQAVREARAKADWVIVQAHAGLEMVGLPLPEWRQRYHEMIDLGADLVIGHHPHVLQGSESYKGKMIHYSLGNFYMDVMLKQADPGSGAALRVQIDDQGIQSEIIPLKVDSGMISIDMSDETHVHYRNLSDILTNNEAYYAEVQSICDDFWRTVYLGYYQSALIGLGTKPGFTAAWRVFSQLAAGFFRGRINSRVNELMLIHNIRIETHRWVVERALADRVKI